MVGTRLRAKIRHRTTRRLGGDRPQRKWTTSQIFSRFSEDLVVNQSNVRPVLIL